MDHYNQHCEALPNDEFKQVKAAKILVEEYRKELKNLSLEQLIKAHHVIVNWKIGTDYNWDIEDNAPENLTAQKIITTFPIVQQAIFFKLSRDGKSKTS